MPFLVNWVIVTRPNTNVSFYEFSDDDLSHFEQTYTNTGLLHSLSQPMSTDGLSRTTRFVWYVNNGQEAFNIQNILADDPRMTQMMQAIDAYNEENGIQKSTMFFEVRDDDGNILDADDLTPDLWLVRDGVFVNHHR